MKAFIRVDGDMSVGISSCCLVVDFENIEIDREQTRKQLSVCFSEILDDNAYIVFDDECPDCLTINGHKNTCPNNFE